MKSKWQSWVCLACFLFASSASAQEVLVDARFDGVATNDVNAAFDFTTNVNGANGSFDLLNGVLSQSGVDDGNPTIGIVSSIAANTKTGESIRLEVTVQSVTHPQDSNGLFIGWQHGAGGTTTGNELWNNSGAPPAFGFVLDGDAGRNAKIAFNHNGGKVESTIFDPPTTASVADGFTVDLIASSNGWSVALSGLQTATAVPVTGGTGTWNTLAIEYSDFSEAMRAAVFYQDADELGVLTLSELTLSAQPFPDTDMDGLPDFWEMANNLDHTSGVGNAGANGDPDGDNLDNSQEFLLGTHPGKADSDGDQLDDDLELAQGTDPLNADSDGDTLLDGDEVLAGTNPLLRDTDGDGLEDQTETITDPTKFDTDGDTYNDAAERAFGTNPNDENSVPNIVASTPTPNVLLIYADDLGFSDMAAYGAVFGTTSTIPTPNMDALADEGMLFTQAHSSSGVCTPSRYGILTGRYSWRLAGDGVLPSGIVGAYGNPIIRQGELTIAQFLSNQGYRTAAFGKWHLGAQFFDRSGVAFTGNSTGVSGPADIDLHRIEGHAVHRGFDSFFGMAETINRPPYAYMRDDQLMFNGAVPVPGTHPWVQLTGAQLGAESPNGLGDPNVPQIDYGPDMIEETELFLAAQATKTQPFFAYVSLYSPHAPHLPTPAFQGSVGFEYGDFVHETDDWIGRVIDAVDNNGMYSNTVVIITSDNGPETHAYTDSRTAGHDSNGPLRGVKRDSWEGGTRVPFVIRWPGQVAPGLVSNELIWQGDIFATIAAFLGQDLGPNDAPDAESFLNVIRGQAKPARRRDTVVIASVSNQLSIKTNDGWKLIDGTGSGGNNTSYDADDVNISSASGTKGGTPKQLFYLPSDLGERQNLETSETVMRDTLLARLAQYRTTPTSDIPPPDNDLDGMSNAFENQYGLGLNNPGDAVGDLDSDALSNLAEFQHASDPTVGDTDGDGIGDGTEVHTYGTFPVDPHSDPDTLNDGDEVYVYFTNPLVADSDGDGVNDDLELQLFANPRNDQSVPNIVPTQVQVIAPALVQLVGVNGDGNDPQVQGAFGWPEAGTVFLRERSTTGSSQSYRTQLFLQFDLSSMTNDLVAARLNSFQTHKLNGNTGAGFTADLEWATVTEAWSTNAPMFPVFATTSVTNETVFGRSDDFGSAANSVGFRAADVSPVVADWLAGAVTNNGLRVRLVDRSLVGVAFADSGTNAVSLVVTTQPPQPSFDSDDDRLHDTWETQYFTNLTFTVGGIDFDGDGFLNFEEQAFGSDPLNAASQPHTLIDQALELSFLRSTDIGIGYEMEQSTNLVDWIQAVDQSLVFDTVTDLENGYEEVVYRVASNMTERVYFRVSPR